VTITSSARGSAWEDVMSHLFMGLTSRPIHAEMSVGHVEQTRLGMVDVFALTGNPQQVSRSAAASRKLPADLVKVVLMTEGEANFCQGGAEFPLRAGEFAVYQVSRSYRLTMPHARWRGVVMTLPSTALGLSSDILHRARQRAHCVDGTGQPLQAVLEGASSLRTSSPSARHRIGLAVIGLLAATLVDVDDALVQPPNLALRYAVLDSIKTHLSDPDLSTASLARDHQMSPRTLQRLFENEGRGVEGMIRDLRLEAVRQDLADPAMSGRAIADIAARWHISDASWLSRAFRDRYGVSPSRYRHSASTSPASVDSAVTVDTPRG